MSIEHLKEKIKRIAGVLGDPDIFTAGVIVLVAFLSFGLGRLSVQGSARPPVIITNTPAAAIVSRQAGSNAPNIPDTPNPAIKGDYVASKNGTKYYFPWCSGATRIKEENKIWFQTTDEAKKAGYQPASTCKGL